jgi:hypothetical protein
MRQTLLPIVAMSYALGCPNVSADSPANVPCRVIADHLQQFSQSAANPADGFPENALSAPESRVQALAARPYGSLLEAVQAVGNPKRSDGSRNLTDGTYVNDAPNGGTPTVIFDLRPYNTDLVIFDQDVGSMHCSNFAIFGIRNGAAGLRLKSDDPETGERLCAKADPPYSWLGAIRVDSNAYPVIWKIDVGHQVLDDTLTLLDISGAQLCTVAIGFNPKIIVGDLYIAPSVDAAFANRIRPIVEPIAMSSNQDAARQLSDFAPRPTGNSAYDRFVANPTDASLAVIDPSGITKEVPDSDGNGLEIHQTPVPFTVDGHSLLLVVDRPWFGERQLPDNAFGVWEWNGTELKPVMGGQVEEAATRPTIAVR